MAPLGKFASHGECHMSFLGVKGLIKNDFNLIVDSQLLCISVFSIYQISG